MRFASFFSGGFITKAVINPPESKLAKRTSVHCTTMYLLDQNVKPSKGVCFFSEMTRINFLLYICPAFKMVKCKIKKGTENVSLADSLAHTCSEGGLRGNILIRVHVLMGQRLHSGAALRDSFSGRWSCTLTCSFRLFGGLFGGIKETS